MGAESLPPEPIRYASKKKAQDAHEAIRPTYLDLPPERIRQYLSKERSRDGVSIHLSLGPDLPRV